MNRINLSDYFELQRPTYKYVKITPHKSIRNYNSSNIAKAITYTYQTLSKRLHREKGKYKWLKTIKLDALHKISYVIDIENGNASFYFIVPTIFLPSLLEKMREIWSKATIEIMEEGLKPFSDNSIQYSLSYKKEDALSLQVDKKSNEPLNSLLSVMEIMKDDDRITIIYNFMPTSQFGWKDQYDGTMKKIMEKKSIDKKKLSIAYIAHNGLVALLNGLESILNVVNDFLGNNNSTGAQESLMTSIMGVLERQDDLSIQTKKKKEATILNTQIGVVSYSKDDTRRINNAMSTCQAYRVLDEDNELVVYQDKKVSNIEDYSITEKYNMMSCDEASNFIQVPGRALLTQMGIKHIDVEEAQVPAELRKGTMCIGEVTYKGAVTNAYLSSDKDYRNLTICAIGPTRAGKSTLLANLSKNAIDNNETVIVFDFCGQCELSNDISNVVPTNKVLNIDCKDTNKLEGLDYSEIKAQTDDVFEVYDCAKSKTQQVITLVNSVNADSKLEPRMERYLEAASIVGFITNASIREIFEMLKNHKKRKEFIGKVPKNQLDNLQEYIDTLEELDDWSKPSKDNPSEVVGTRLVNIQGILNRVNKLKSNTYLEMMLKKDSTKNINLIDEMQKSELICLRMPEKMFKTETEKDIYCTYWLTRIWGALQIRHEQLPNVSERIKVNIIFDELYQVPKCQDFLRTKLNQIAKKTCKPIISCHSLEQMKYIRPELKSANTSYMLVAGCNKDNYNELKEELEPFELEDLLNLKRYHSLNLIKTSNGYAKFISKLPEPVK